MRIAGGFSLSREVEDILIADAALTIGFALVLSGGVFGVSSFGFILMLPIALVAVSLSFVLHELMHKFVAQRFGAMAAFRKSDYGIIITLITSVFGFLIGLPGATVIYAPHFTRKEEGYVSLAGPLTNFAVFAVFFVIGSVAFSGFSQNFLGSLQTTSLTAGTYLRAVVGFTVFISIYLAFFNMLPIMPLDGSKVLKWSKPVYFTMMATIFVLLFMITGLALIPNLVFILIIALVLSMVYRSIIF